MLQADKKLNVASLLVASVIIHAKFIARVKVRGNILN